MAWELFDIGFYRLEHYLKFMELIKDKKIIENLKTKTKSFGDKKEDDKYLDVELDEEIKSFFVDNVNFCSSKDIHLGFYVNEDDYSYDCIIVVYWKRLIVTFHVDHENYPLVEKHEDKLHTIIKGGLSRTNDKYGSIERQLKDYLSNHEDIKQPMELFIDIDFMSAINAREIEVRVQPIQKKYKVHSKTIEF